MIDGIALSPCRPTVSRSQLHGANQNLIKIRQYHLARRTCNTRRASFPTDRSFRFETISWSADGRACVSAQKEARSPRKAAVIEIATGIVTRIAIRIASNNQTVWLTDGSGLIITGIDQESDSSVPHMLFTGSRIPKARSTDHSRP